MNGFNGYDIAVGSAFGIRRWQVDDLGRLIAQSAGTVWKPGVNVAECTNRGGSIAAQTVTAGSIMANAVAWQITGYPHPAPTRAEITATASECPACAALAAEKATQPRPKPAARPPHVVPAEGCGCGFWAFHQGYAGYGSGGLVGIIEASGRTIIGTKGFRTAQAKIVALCMPQSTPPPEAKDWREHTAVGVAIGAVAGLVFVASVILGPVRAGPLWLAFPMFGSLLAGYVAVQRWRDWRKERRDSRFISGGFVTMRFPGERDWPDLTPTLLDKVRRNYPDVTIFPTEAAMLSEYPVESALEPSPETDPEFWTRPAVTS